MSEAEHEPRVIPSRKCPECKGYIEGEAVLMKRSTFSVEYCSTDCLLDAYERKSHRNGPYRMSRVRVCRKSKLEGE